MNDALKEAQNDLTDYFTNIIDSKMGLELIKAEMENLDFEDRLISNYMISLGIQYKSGVIEKKELMMKAGEMLMDIQK